MKILNKIGLSLMLISMSSAAWSAAFPDRPITLVSPFPAGGGGDAIARLLAEAMSKSLDVSVIVENVPGAGASIGTMRVVRAAPDGYTLLLHNNGLANTPALYPNLKLDVQNDLRPVGVATAGALTLVGRSDRKEGTPEELFERIRSDGARMNFASAGPGSLSHLAILLLKEKLGNDFTVIPYKGTGPAMNDLLGGHIDLLVDQIPAGQLSGGRLKPYAVTSRHRLVTLPEVKTFQEAGVKDYAVDVWQTLFAPAGMPDERMQVLNRGLREALLDEKVIKGLKERGIGTASLEHQSEEGARKVLAEETLKWRDKISPAS